MRTIDMGGLRMGGLRMRDGWRPAAEAHRRIELSIMLLCISRAAIFMMIFRDKKP